MIRALPGCLIHTNEADPSYMIAAHQLAGHATSITIYITPFPTRRRAPIAPKSPARPPRRGPTFS